MKAQRCQETCRTSFVTSLVAKTRTTLATAVAPHNGSVRRVEFYDAPAQLAGSIRLRRILRKRQIRCRLSVAGWYSAIGAAVLALAILPPFTGPAAADPLPSVKHMENPFVGATLYRNVDYVAAVNAAADRESGTLGRRMRKVADYPTFIWLDSIAAVHGKDGYARGLQSHLDTALEQGANAIGIVIYNLPNRDGSALASNGELQVAKKGLERYQAEYIDAIYKIINQPKYVKLRIVMVIEPDSLPNLVTNTSFPRVKEAETSGAYVQGIQYAIGNAALRAEYLCLR